LTPVQKAQGTLRVVIYDRRRLMREGLATLLAAEPGIVVVAAVENTADLAAVAHQAEALICADPIAVPPGCTAQVFRLADESPAALIERLRYEADVPPPPSLRLTSREAEIMRGIADGLSTGHIGALLGISPKTVENHKQRIFAKLGVQSQSHAVVVAYASGLLDRAADSA